MAVFSSLSSTTRIYGVKPKPTTKWVIIKIIRRKRNQNTNQNGEKLFQRHFIGLRIYVPVYSLSDHGQYWGMLRSVRIRRQEIVRAGVCVCVFRRNLLRYFSWFLKISNIFAKIIILKSDFFRCLEWFMEMFILYSSSWVAVVAQLIYLLSTIKNQSNGDFYGATLYRYKFHENRLNSEKKTKLVS